MQEAAEGSDNLERGRGADSSCQGTGMVCCELPPCSHPKGAATAPQAPQEGELFLSALAKAGVRSRSSMEMCSQTPSTALGVPQTSQPRAAAPGGSQGWDLPRLLSPGREVLSLIGADMAIFSIMSLVRGASSLPSQPRASLGPAEQE